MTIYGKGFYIWQIPRCEGGDPQAIAAAAEAAGLSHVLIKIADGTSPYNIDLDTGADLVPPVVAALRARNITPLGWHYVYGYDPFGEADIAIQRLGELDLDMYVIDAEAQYKDKETEAYEFMAQLRASLPDYPMALSTYRYPTYHPSFPFQAFLESVDYNMPQVYWVLSHNPGEQLIRCLREYEAIQPFRPIIPTGSAYLQGDWSPSVSEIVEFLDTARSLNMTAANFWEWGHTRLYLPELWYAVSAYYWPADGSPLDITERYIQALNAADLDALMALYHDDAVHVTADRTLNGKAAIRLWYQALFTQTLPGAAYILGEVAVELASRRFTWTALSGAGNVSDGYDTFGLVSSQIIYHYTYFNIT